MSTRFNPKEYKDKKRIQTPTQTSGISKCWTWDERINEYVCKSYEARKSSLAGRAKMHFDSAEQAKAWLHGVVEQAQPEQEHNSPKFEEVVNHWLEIHMPLIRVSTQRHYRDLLKGLAWFSDKHMDDISPDLIDSWLIEAKNKQYRTARFSLKKELKLLKQLLNHYREYFNNSYQSPVLKRHSRLTFIKEPPVKNRDLPEADFKKFREKLEAFENGRLYAALATLQYYCCLRISEAAGVFKEDLKFGDKPEYNRGVFRRALKTSGYKGEKASIGDLKNSKEIGGYKTQSLHPEIIKYVEPIANQVDKGPIFKIDGKFLSKRQIEYKYNLAFEAAGLECRGTHVLRHGGVTEYFSKHGNLGIAKTQLGVKSMKTVEVYVKPLQKDADNFMYEIWKRLAANGCKTESEKKDQENPNT